MQTSFMRLADGHSSLSVERAELTKTTDSSLGVGADDEDEADQYSRAAATEELPQHGQSFAEFELKEIEKMTVYIGLLPVEFDIENGVNLEDEEGGCLYSSYSGKCYPAGSDWSGIQGAAEGDRIGMLHDSVLGSLAVFKNGQRLGLMQASGLTGRYQFGVCMFDKGDCVQLTGRALSDIDPEAEAVAAAPAAAAGESASPEDGSVELFIALLQQMKIKPDQTRAYATGLVAQGYDMELFNEATLEELRGDFGFIKGDLKRVEKFRSLQAGDTGGSSEAASPQNTSDGTQPERSTSGRALDPTAMSLPDAASQICAQVGLSTEEPMSGITKKAREFLGMDEVDATRISLKQNLKDICDQLGIDTGWTSELPSPGR